ncbi:glycoside hydrolase family 88/105 protein [Neolewinella antarctica]|uniref:Rhamnogalacturonyl hydrolase YesR n=1 Tax=Neolewinella antarctica TaxID=442734 RepID=A0ABX0X6U0_9BACT|nr:glycoside hydrolase family 88 protein [Neolewinella antarctica]NJC24923.1 rhamnogalacturonyl hydrolase YesR [Neolewinella antarctica]
MSVNQLTLPLLLLIFLASCASAPRSNKRDEIEDKLVKALTWQEAHPIFEKNATDWTNGAYYTGVARAHQATDNPVFLKAIEDMGGRTEWKPYDRYYYADDIAIAYPYLYLNEQRPGIVDLEPVGTWIDDHLEKDHEWKQGTRTDMRVILWWWCDALFMAPPALAQWSALKNDRRYLDRMHEYYTETYDLLYDKEEHLFARDTRFVWTGAPADKKGGSGKKIFWSRGNGWVMGGLALLLDKMPQDYEHRPFYVNLYQEMAAKIKSIQPADGMWRVSLLEPEAWPHGETSGTGFYTFALAWGINNGLLSKKEYGDAVTRAWTSLTAIQEADGKVTWVQNIGDAPRPASADSWQNFGTGAFLLAGSEVMKLK